MNGEDYRTTRERLDLTQPQLAKRLDLHTQTISKRERGILPVTTEAEYAIRYLLIPDIHRRTIR